MKVYVRLVGWAEGHDAEKIVYTTSLQRGSAGTWMTPYIEDLKQPSWCNLLLSIARFPEGDPAIL